MVSALSLGLAAPREVMHQLKRRRSWASAWPNSPGASRLVPQQKMAIGSERSPAVAAGCAPFRIWANAGRATLPPAPRRIGCDCGPVRATCWWAQAHPIAPDIERSPRSDQPPFPRCAVRRLAVDQIDPQRGGSIQPLNLDVPTGACRSLSATAWVGRVEQQDGKHAQRHTT